jgi:hypothetical protein
VPPQPDEPHDPPLPQPQETSPSQPQPHSQSAPQVHSVPSAHPQPQAQSAPQVHSVPSAHPQSQVQSSPHPQPPAFEPIPASAGTVKATAAARTTPSRYFIPNLLSLSDKNSIR